MNKRINCEVITNYILKNNLTKNEFCKQCKISLYALNKIFKNDNAKMETIYKILMYTNIKTKNLLKF